MLADSLEDEGEVWEIDVGQMATASQDDDEFYEGGSTRGAVAAALASSGDSLEREPTSRVQRSSGGSRGKGMKGGGW